MDGFINTGLSLIAELQKPSVVAAAICYLIAFYLMMTGGDQGRQKAKSWFIWTTVGLVGINAVIEMANLVNNNIKF